MAILWSPSECGFFNTRVNYAKLPEDCIEITEEQHQKLMQAQMEGWQIVNDANGRPDLVKRE